MNNKPSDIQKKLQRLQSDYAGQLADKIDEIENTWRQVTSGTSTEQALQEVVRLCHSLAGTAGSFGFTGITHRAREMEHRLENLRDQQTLSAEFIDDLEKLLQQLKAAAAQAASD